MQTFSEQLIAARTAKGMTQEALAQAVSVTRSTISSWERGRTQPDLGKLRLLSEVLGYSFTWPDDATRQDAPAVSDAPPDQPRAGARPRLLWLIAGAAVLVCVCVAVLLNMRHRSAPEGGSPDAFPVDEYRRELPNDPDKAYFTFNNKVWQEKGDSAVYQRYDFVMLEQNGIGFTVTRAEAKLEGRRGSVRAATLSADDLLAAGVNPEVPPYGSFNINGGFPEGEFARAGIAVYGNDANGNPLCFRSLIEF